MTLSGLYFIGADARSSGTTFRAIDPTEGAAIGPEFFETPLEDVAEACRLAASAFVAFNETAPDARAAFLETIAANIEAAGDALIERAMAETGLPRPRLEGERARTVGQIRLFADVLRRGHWVGARLDGAAPDRKPLPRPDLRLRKVGIGPVAVFGASNFPLAFSVAGGDTASALAAGCPVVCKGHPAHPGVSEIVGRAVLDAVQSCGLPNGVFSLVSGPSNALGATLAADPHIRAIAFTGSRTGGLALWNVANARPLPIPIYAEMSSINPTLLLPHALAARTDALARGFVASLTLGAGQFCTNPGLVLAVDGPALETFTTIAVDAVSTHPGAVMLSPAIHDNYVGKLEHAAGQSGVTVLAAGGSMGGARARPAILTTTAAAFRATPSLAEEIFGAAAIIVRCADESDFSAVLSTLEGQLTATMHMDDDDVALARTLLPLLEARAGRIIANGWPTGVEVAHAMVHGGPFPATSDVRSTSVGSLAIERFLRPICYQDIPDALLPPALAESNPWRLMRLVDGEWRNPE